MATIGALPVQKKWTKVYDGLQQGEFSGLIQSVGFGIVTVRVVATNVPPTDLSGFMLGVEPLPVLVSNTESLWARVSDNVGHVVLGNAEIGASGAITLAYSGPWETRPSAAELPANSLVFISNFPSNILGSWWKPVPFADIFSPSAGDMLVNTFTDRDSVDNDQEQILDTLTIPKGMIFPQGFKLSSDSQLAKSTNLIGCTFRFRIGDTGTVADPVVQEVYIAALSRSARVSTSIGFPTFDSATCCPTEMGEFGESLTVWPANVPIPDVSTNDTKVSLSVQMDTAGGYVTIKNFTCNAQLL